MNRKNILIKISLLTTLLLTGFSLVAQRQMENLNHGLLSVQNGSGNLVSWRVLAAEYDAVGYNLYRDGVLLNTSPIDGASNYLDAEGSAGSNYELRTVIGGVEHLLNETCSTWSKSYLDIPVRELTGNTVSYELNDASVGDLDGDGEYEIVVKRLANNESAVNATDFHFLEAYELDGTFLWAINIGPNINDKVEFNFLVWDLDNDGKAEVAVRTSEGTIDGLGNVIGDIDGDGITNYRYSISYYGYRTEGPDFLSIFDGETGEEITRADYIQRDPILQWGESGMNITQLSHRATKCMFTVAYIDGKNPSVVISRGIYHKIAMEAWNFDGSQLTQQWYFASDQAGNEDYKGQGYHNLTQGDVDNDGRDEIMYGSMCVDDDGTGLYSTTYGHGDAQHLADINPDWPGIEYFGCLENSGVWGGNYRNAGTGEIYYHKGIGRDMGRAGCSDITSRYAGMEMWGPTGFPFLTSYGTEISSLTPPSSMNFFIWWDGDPLREILDHAWYTDYGIGTITKYNDGANTRLLTANGTLSNNYTKGNPCVSADILGDWREEVIWRLSDNSGLRIYTTPYPTDIRIYTLMQDPQYRAAIGWQPNSYNQPPHPSFFIGHNMDSIPPAPVMLNGQVTWNSGNWDNGSATSWLSKETPVSFQDGDSVLFDISAQNAPSVNITASVSPADIRVISPYDFVFSGEGSIDGQGGLTKDGLGKLTISNTNHYSGITRIWDGELELSGNLVNSKVLVKRFATLSGKGLIGKGLTLEKFSTLDVGTPEADSDTLFLGGDLEIGNNITLYFDLAENAVGASDIIVVNGDLLLETDVTIDINPLTGTLTPGNYILADVSGTFTGDLENITLTGISSIPKILKVENNNLVLEIPVTRGSSTVTWIGNIDNEWDIYEKQNWQKDGAADYFIGNDTVVFNDLAQQTNIQILDDYSVSHILFESSKTMSVSGDGSITGTTSMVKKGTGTFKLNTPNTFTGVTTIEEGVLQIETLTNGGEASGIGAADAGAQNLVLNGGTLEITATGNNSTNRSMTFGENNGTLDLSSEGSAFTLGTALEGPGYLIKEGPGMLNLYPNNHKGTIISEGVVNLVNEDANFTGPGEEVIFRGGELAMYNNLNTTTDNCAWDIVVEAGQTGSITLDGRCSLTGNLTGSGTLDLTIPWLHSEFKGDWSGFQGTVNAHTDSDGGLFIVSNTSGYKNAALTLDPKVTLLYGPSEDATIEIGELQAPAGAILGAGGEAANTITWKLGGKNTNASFDGLINDSQIKNSGARAALVKTGSGMLILTNANTYSGETTVEGGFLMISNTSGSATGTGNIVCKSGSYLAGAGSVDGNIELEGGSMLLPAYSNMGVFTTKGSFTMQDKSTLRLDVNAETGQCDQVYVGANASLNGTLYLSNNSDSSYKEGDYFQILVAEGTIEGAFSKINPIIPGDSLIWDMSKLTAYGIIRVKKGVLNDELENFSLNTPRIYPNPFDNEVIIEYDYPLNEDRIKLYTMDGRQLEVKKEQVSGSGWKLKTSYLEAGKYVIVVTDSNGVNSSHVIIKAK